MAPRQQAFLAPSPIYPDGGEPSGANPPTLSTMFDDLPISDPHVLGELYIAIVNGVHVIAQSQG